MATRKKTVKAEEKDSQVLNTGAETAAEEAKAEGVAQEMDAAAETHEPETQETVEHAEAEGEADAKEQKPDETQEIPANVDRLLKTFSDYEELYVDDKGSVFTKDTQPNLVEGAILYQNPYYNK